MRVVRRALGSLLGVVVAIWVRTLRVVVESRVSLKDETPRVFAFFHGQQMALLAFRPRRRLSVMVSRSNDGELQAAVMRRLGFGVVRGSSSSHGGRALAEIVTALRDGASAAFAVDGPRGPTGIAKRGAAVAAGSSGAELVAVASAASGPFVIRGAWDRFEIPLPFSRVAIVVGKPISAAEARRRPEVLDASLRDARARAEGLVGRSDSGAPSRFRAEVP